MAESIDNLSFGKRIGIEPVEIPFQVNDIDQVLRIELWNAFHIYIYGNIEDNSEQYRYSHGEYRTMHKYIWVHFFKYAIDDFPHYNVDFKNYVRHHIESKEWYKVYELFEFLFKNIPNNSRLYKMLKFEEYLNVKLRINNSAFTLVNGRFIKITNETELDELKELQQSAKHMGLLGVQQHLNTALELLSQKPTPDYRNSIKESISMVEAICRIIEPSESTLGKALIKLDDKEKINPILKSAFEKMYAYTNGKNGIRHALMDDSKVDFEDAKFFLVSCSAFTNYLIEKAKKDNIPLT